MDTSPIFIVSSSLLSLTGEASELAGVKADTEHQCFFRRLHRIQWMIQSIFNHKNAAVASRYAAVAHAFHVEKVQEVLRRRNKHFG